MLRAEIARTVEQVERLETAWSRLPWEREEAEHEYFLTRTRLRADVIAPYSVIVFPGQCR